MVDVKTEGKEKEADDLKTKLDEGEPLRSIYYRIHQLQLLFLRVMKPQVEATNHKSDQHYRLRFSHLVSDCFSLTF